MAGLLAIGLFQRAHHGVRQFALGERLSGHLTDPFLADPTTVTNVLGAGHGIEAVDTWPVNQVVLSFKSALRL